MLQDQSRNRTPMPAAQLPAGAASPEPEPARAEAAIAQMLTSTPSSAPTSRSNVSDDLRAALDELAAADAAGWAETNDDDEAFDVHAARQDAADDAVLATPCRSLSDVGAKLTCLIPRIRPDLLNQRHAEHLEVIRADLDRMSVSPDAALLVLTPMLLPMLDDYDRLWAAGQDAYDRAAGALGGEPHYDVVGRDAAEDWHRRFVASPGYTAYVEIRRPADALGDRIEAMIAAHMEVPARTLDGLLLKQRIGRSLEYYGDVAAEDLDRLVSVADGPGEVAATSTATGSEIGAAILVAAEGASPALVAMVEEWQALLDQINGGGLSDAAVEQLGVRHDELQRAVYNFPAGSIADLLAKVPVFRDELYDATGSLDDGCKVEDTFSGAAWLGLFRDFERLARVALATASSTNPILTAAPADTSMAASDEPASIEFMAEQEFEAFKGDERAFSAWNKLAVQNALAMGLVDRLLGMSKAEMVADLRAIEVAGEVDPETILRTLDAAQKAFEGWSQLLELVVMRFLVAGSTIAMDDQAKGEA